jgi:spore germination cell wall hydrolase CwlJ-like protein
MRCGVMITLEDVTAATGRYGGRLARRVLARKDLASLRVAILPALAAAVALLVHHHVKPARERHYRPELRTRRFEQHLPALGEQRLLDLSPEGARQMNADQPFVPGTPPKAAAYFLAGDEQSHARAVDCLAAAEWFEAGDNTEEERAVAQVVINRVWHPAFPKSICGVVFDGSERRTGCQFTFTCDGALGRTPSEAAWKRARQIAEASLTGFVDKPIGYATHYHTDWVVPYWRSELDKIAQVGTHLFYRWSGYWGTAPSFRRHSGEAEPMEPKLAGLSQAHVAFDPLMLPGPQQITKPVTGLTPGLVPVATDAIPPLSAFQVLGHSPDGAETFVLINAVTPPPSYPEAAIRLCQQKPKCLVFAWQNPTEMAIARPITGEQMRALAFVYLRDKRGEKSLWNCTKSARAQMKDCLPKEGLVLAQLAG